MKKAVFVFGVLLLAATSAYSMTVEEAYRSIPHARTVFDAGSSRLPQDEREALVRLFAIIDEAIVLRVEAFQARAAKDEEYASLKARLASTEVPGKLHNFRQLVSDAIREQAAYLKKKPRRINTSDKAVGTASGKLHAAYGELMGLYPSENAQNKQAFFDYLCALDFI